MPWKFTDVSNLCLFLPCHTYLVPGTCGVDLDPSCYEAVLSIWVCMFHLQHIPGSLTKLCISLHPFLHIYQFMTHIMLLQSVTSVRACPWNHRRYRNHRRSWPRIVFKVWRQKVRWFLRFPGGNAQRFDMQSQFFPFFWGGCQKLWVCFEVEAPTCFQAGLSINHTWGNMRTQKRHQHC